LIGPGSGYDKTTRPKIAEKRAQGGASGGFWPPERDEAWTQLRVLSIDNVDTKTQTVKLQVYLNVIWYDWRLAWNTTATGGCIPMTTSSTFALVPGAGDGTKVPAGPSGDISYNSDMLAALWEPSLYAENMIEEKVMASAVWLSPQGRVWSRQKAQWVLSCPMDFRYMPFDEQRLFARISAWKYSPGELKISFGQPGIEADSVIDDVCRPENSEWTVINMESFETQEADDEMGFFTITIKRKHKAFTSQITSVWLLVFLGWTSFFISRAAVPARVALSVIGLLTITNVSNSISSSLPRLSGAVWLLDMVTASLAFIAYCSFEFTLVNVLHRVEQRVDKARVAAVKRQADEKAALSSPPPSPPETSPGRSGRKESQDEQGKPRRHHRKRRNPTDMPQPNGELDPYSENSKRSQPEPEPVPAVYKPTPTVDNASACSRPEIVAAQKDAPPPQQEPQQPPVQLGAVAFGAMPPKPQPHPNRHMPSWNSRGYLHAPWSHKDGKPLTLRQEMLKQGVCKLDRFLLKHDGNLVFRDQHIDIFSRWVYPIAYVMMLLIIFNTLPDGTSKSSEDAHLAGVPAYCSGRGADMVAVTD
jgi:hypothetical protein